MRKIMERIIVNLITIMYISQEIFKILLVNMLSMVVLKFPKDFDNQRLELFLL